MRVGLITGLMEEAAQFRPRDGKQVPDTPYYLREDDRFAILCAGVGKVNAAMAATVLVARGCNLLVSMGSAGRLRPGSSGVFWVSEAIQHDYGARRPGGFATFTAGTLPLGTASVRPFKAIKDPGLHLPEARILTGDRFVEQLDAALRLAERFDADLIDMETGAIAQVAAAHDIGWAGIRAVSDEADEQSAGNFKKNLDRAARTAAREASRLVDILA